MTSKIKSRSNRSDEKYEQKLAKREELATDKINKLINERLESHFFDKQKRDTYDQRMRKAVSGYVNLKRNEFELMIERNKSKSLSNL